MLAALLLASSQAPGAKPSIENGPTADLRLQWATYFDAADQSGQSRLFGGIHIFADDRAGRLVGSAVGRGAAARARALWDGDVE